MKSTSANAAPPLSPSQSYCDQRKLLATRGTAIKECFGGRGILDF
ncbi:MAG: hypothetical protein WBA74_06110 [Cyclobacteriaceae bacterium]